MQTHPHCHRLLIFALCLACFLPLLYQAPAHAKTAAQFLAEAPAPQFKSGHTLPRLTRWGWWMSYEGRVELCDRWGYALEWVELSGNDMDDPNSIASRVCTLSASDPQRYPLAVVAPRPFQDPAFIASLPESAWCHDATGARIKRFSPIMPDEVYLRAGAVSAATIARIRKNCPIAIVLNGGEYGLDVYGWGGADWEKDPAVVAAKGTRSWFDFISERKAHYESLVANATRAAAPDLQEYLYYHTDAGVDRQRYDFWWQWVWDYRYMRQVSTRPNSSLYYLEFNTGWAGSIDLLTQTLNATGAQIAQGDPLAYHWVCSGWLDGKFADDQRYMGFLKSLYTSGMIGAVAGYFSYPSTGFTGDLGPTPPNWLTQMQTLSHAHGLFSYLEDYLRHGDLLPGPNKHRWSTDLPAYEFPTGDETARVLARKVRGKSEWLICAWAAAGPDRQVTVTIPELGVVNVLARATGTIYRAQPGPMLTLLDPDGMRPSAQMTTIQAACGPNGSISIQGQVAVPAGSTQTFAFTPQPGYQVADVQVDGHSVGACPSYTFTNVKADHTLYVTFAPAATGTLSVQSQPAGIGIAGAPYGITPYVAQLSYDALFTLSAPAQVVVDGISNAFVRWVYNGISQPIGQTVLQDCLRAANGTVEAIYQTVATNIAPLVQDRTFTTTMNQGFPLTLTGTDPDGDALTYAIVTPPTKGFVGAGGTPGVFFFMPAKDYSGTETFTYKANDGKLDSNVATVAITVTPIDPAPAATGTLSVQSQPAGIGIAGAPYGITPYVAQLPFDALFTLTAPAQVVVDGISNAFVRWVYNGIDQPIGQTVLEDYLCAANGTVEAIYQVVATNIAPLVQDRTFTTTMNQGFPLTLTGTDPEGDALTYAIVTPPTKGFVGAGGTPGLFFFMPAKDYTGTETFTYKANDGKIDSNVATVAITVTPVDPAPVVAPVAVSKTIAVRRNRSVRITLTGTDANGNNLTFRLTSTPRNGRLSGVVPQLTYQPNFFYVGADDFTFIVNNGKVDSQPATIRLVIK